MSPDLHREKLLFKCKTEFAKIRVLYVPFQHPPFLFPKRKSVLLLNVDLSTYPAFAIAFIFIFTENSYPSLEVRILHGKWRTLEFKKPMGPLPSF
jgi:hypothetical protein